jgi:hypothetical protein
MRRPGRRLLIITYYFPPERSVGAHRWRAMSRWLRRLGHEVTVLTTTAFGRLPDDGEETQRAFDLAASPALRRLFRRPPVSDLAAAEPQMGEGAPPAILADLLVPDAHALTWNPAAALAARRLVRQHRIDCVITSSPPHSTHLIPFALGPRRPAWIADFRDGWRFESLRRPWPLPGQSALDGFFERKVARTADHVIGVTRPIAGDLAGRLQARSACVTNAWDPDLENLVAHADVPQLDPDTVNIVHAGKLYVEGSNRRDPGPLGPALRLLLERRPDAARRLRILVAGRPDPKEERYTGMTVPIDDAEGLAGAFEAALGGKLTERYSPHDLDRYTYPAPARQMAELVERAIAERAGDR